jgi:HEAT repeat protein
MNAQSPVARTATLCGALALCVSALTFGHGGTYRGPGDTVPPGGGGSGGGAGPPSPGPSSGGSGGSGSPGPSLPGTGGGGGVGSPTSSPVTPSGGVGGPDLTAWTFWWEFNKDPYLNLKASIFTPAPRTGSDGYYLGDGQQQEKDSQRPTDTQIRATIVPALLAALKTESNNDIVTGCLIALAKIGDASDEAGDSAFTEVIGGFLDDEVQEIRETAAIALGILANKASIPLLASLLTDGTAGRAASGGQEVAFRTRAFAAYGLGLLGARTADESNRVDVLAALAAALKSSASSMHDVKVACVIGMGMVRLDRIQGAVDAAASERLDCRADQIEALLALFRDEKAYHPLVRAHAPRALTRLLGGLQVEDREAFKLRIADALLAVIAPHAKAHDALKQSAVLALGALGDDDADPLDARIRAALLDADSRARDQAARRFALIALAQSDGRVGDGERPAKGLVTRRLLSALGKGTESEKAWAGIAIGVRGYALNASGAQVPADATTALRSALFDSKSQEVLGAYAIGLGLLRDLDSQARLLALVDSKNDDGTRGYASIGLGLMNAAGAIETIERVVRESKYQPVVLQQAAIALGLLGDKRVVGELADMLRESKTLSSQAAIAKALGAIGDRDSVEPLVAMLRDQDLTAAARGFAAAALGIVADLKPLPWNSEISVDLNYLAATATLNSQDGLGVLNLL